MYVLLLFLFSCNLKFLDFLFIGIFEIWFFLLCWFFLFLCRFNDEVNVEMIEFIKKSVKGVVLDVFFEVLEGKNNNDFLRVSYGFCMIKVYYN